MDELNIKLFASKAAKYKNAICVYINCNDLIFEFCSMQNGDISTFKTKTSPFNNTAFSAEFYDELSLATKSYMTSGGALTDTSVTVIVPDSVVAMDTIGIPHMNKRRNKENLKASLAGFYKNRDELTVNTHFATQNKNTATYSLTVINQKISKSIIVAMKEGGLSPDAITFVSNAKVNAVSALLPEMSTASYLLLDICENYASFSFVANGRTTGFYNLPFGYSILDKNELFAEDMLFDHSSAEFAVFNARVKAKSKNSSAQEKSENEEKTDNVEDELDAMFGSEENTEETNTANEQTKKQPRKLPNFMLREHPTNEREYSYENFRIFIKWCLSLLNSNDKLTVQGVPEAVYVNIPEEFNYLFELTNAEKKENGIEFRPLNIPRQQLKNYLAQYGALFSQQFNTNNNFQ